MAANPVTLVLGDGNAGCLTAVLGKAIADAERHHRVMGDGYSDEQRQQFGIYLGQLRQILTDLHAARETAYGRSIPTT